MPADPVVAYFEGKPTTRDQFEVIRDRVEDIGSFDIDVGSQVSFGLKRKFAWFWLYNVTGKNPNGVLHLMLAIGHQVDDPHARDISQVSKRRWNHQIVISSMSDARSKWLGDLLEAAYRCGEGA